MGILTRLRNAFGKSRKGDAAAAAATPAAEPSVPAARQETAPEPVPAATEPEATVPAPATEPKASVVDELVSAAFDNVTVPKQASPTAEQETKAEPSEKAKAKTKAKAKPVAEAGPAAEPVVEAEPVAEPTTEAEPVAEPVAKAEPVIETEPAAEAEPVVEPEPETKAEPVVAAEAEPVVEAEPVLAAEAEPVVEAEPIVEPEAEVKPEPVVVAEAEAETETEAEVKAEPVVEAEAEAEPETKVEAKPVAEAEPVIKAEPVVEADPVAEAEPIAEPIAEPVAEPEPVVEAEPQPEPVVADVTPEPEPVVEPEPELVVAEVAPEAEPVTVQADEPAVADGESVTSGAGGETGEGTAPATTLAQVKDHAPGLLTAYNAATSTLEKHNLTGTRAKVYLVLDRSASMRPYYKDGSAQALGEQTLALAAHLDPDATVHVVFFSTELDGTGELALPDHENKIDELHAGLGRMGRTSYHAAVQEVLTHHEKSDAPAAPALVIFQTDGAPDAKTPATQSLTDAAKNHPGVFFSFVAFGEQDNKAFDYLRKLKTDNTAFFHAGPTPRELTDTEVYEGVLANWRP
ncbi:VWA domain-containing protein [Streptomyces phaeochromogenes]|uniref:VWA domain-containing protein n=1 Tax=Streptomyces phaeochromogenes TaxID=1923 RepID=UPI002DD9C2AA|nr:VWA domain-containing protein [Streptomyces phaeochromogenes]WRZ30984.1 VWA domain-containing protein [Streptomyces phaeochromogenes]